MKTCGFNFDTTYLRLPRQFFTQLDPEPVKRPKVIVVNAPLAESLGLDFSVLSNEQQSQLFAGKQLPPQSTPFAQAYAGHQFGHFTLLGDGRAHILGEHVTPAGKRVDIQFKGSGRTPYSRRGDGKAALGPMLREYIISEAMHHLGIATTRSLAVVSSGEFIRRETTLPAAILTRVASSHIRVGTFQFAANQGDQQALAALLEYTLQRHYPEHSESENKALALLKAVQQQQAELIVDWMRVGFIHGVMNTDNMLISGESIDYGPCAFMDFYDANTVFSSIDHSRRYAYANQPHIAQWNLARFAETLLPFLATELNKAIAIAEQAVNEFSTLYQQKWLSMMRRKLGLFGTQPGDEQLINDLLSSMQQHHADYTNTFRDLSQTNKPVSEFSLQKSFQEWQLRWQARREKNDQPLQASLSLMRKSNPAVIARNHRVEQALLAAHSGDFKPYNDLLASLTEPYKDQAIAEAYKAPPKPNETVYQTFCGT